MDANDRGFTLIELLIAMAVGLIVLGAVYAVFTVQNKQLANQEQLTEMHQNARIAMEMMVREISMAGYNPTGATARPGIVTAGANSITFSTDITDTSNTTRIPDGLTDGPNEYITYDLHTSDGVQALARRSTSSAHRQPVVENVESLELHYYNGAGTETATLADIRSVKIKIVVRTARNDPGYTDATYGHNHHHYTLSSSCVIQNLGL